MRLTKVSSSILLIVSVMVTAASTQALQGCPNKCGEVEISYPFGIGKECQLTEDFNVHCDFTTGTPMLGRIPFINISIAEGQVCIRMFVANDCYNETGVQVQQNSPWLRTSTFTISNTKNKFIAVGCDTSGTVVGYHNSRRYEIGCSSVCESIDPQETDGTCSGVGCCEVDIPSGWENITVVAKSFNAHKDVYHFNPCSFAFVGEGSTFQFSADSLLSLPARLPLVLDWAIGNETCESTSGNICKGNSKCVDLETRYGYLCKCSDGFQGNPYHPDGCLDIDECKDGKLNNCIHKDMCQNNIGNYTCGCPIGLEGDGRENGTRCQLQVAQRNKNKSHAIHATVGAGVAFVALVVSISWLCLMLQKRKLIKLKQRFFRQNGGLILKQQLHKRERSPDTAKIFTSEELKKATNNYDESLIIGTGGFGTVYKGTLEDNKIVAIKKSKIVDQSQIGQFINEVVVLSQINHRNVVKLLGCCLETEVPLLVYEFVNNGTLHDYIHSTSKSSAISLTTRLRIAAEAAGALAYLHSAATVPIIHRDVKTANILLDDCYIAKVSDFGASRLVPIDQTELATMVQGTLGYLDPEYMLTSQLTEKSDVYSFGVVLLELLTRMKPLSFDRPQENRSLAKYFLICFKEDRLFEILDSGVVNEGNMKLVREVAILAAKCLRVKGDERPGMKEVAMELEGILRMMEEHPWVTVNLNQDEGIHLLHDASGIQHIGSGSSRNTATYDTLRQDFLMALDDGR